MRADELDLRTLLTFQPEAGRLLIGNDRMVLFRTGAFANLRRLLFEQLGHETARSLLLHFGRLCGEGDFHHIIAGLTWDTPSDVARVGPVLHAWEGIVAVAPDTPINQGFKRVTGTWLNSYEADMHLANFGVASEPSCYTLQGYAHGHASCAQGTSILCVETACRAMGDPQCRWEMRPDEEWHDSAPAAALRQAFNSQPRSIQGQLEEQLEIVRRQRGAMAPPVIEVWEGVIALPVIGRVDDERATAMKEALLGAIVSKRARCAILDLTGVESIDRSSLVHLAQMIKAITLLGSACFVSGVSPSCAQTMTELGVVIETKMFRTLKSALQHAIQRTGRLTEAARGAR